MVDASELILEDVRRRQFRKIFALIFVIIMLFLIFYFAGRIISRMNI